jgi:hypothetical protein
MLRGHSYKNVRLLSQWELRRLVASRGLGHGAAPQPALVFERHLGGGSLRAARIYNRIRLWPLFRNVLAWVGPRLQILCER